jgi:hypothetical protein
VTKLNLITLPKATILYVTLLLLVVLPAISIVVFSNVLVDAWCKQFEIPQYEKALGFRMGSVPIADRNGSTRTATGLTWVNSEGPLGRAGLRSGDIPRTQHGIGDFCGDLSLAAKGEPVDIEVINVADLAKGDGYRRRVTISGVRR